MKMSPVRITRTVAILIIVLSTAMVVWSQFQDSDDDFGEAAKPSFKVSVGGPFTLVDHNGKSVTEADFLGRYMLVFFGYTFCPDICPTTLSFIAEAMDILGEDGKDVVPVFISIDPERDTPEQLKDYVENFHPRLVGLTGTPEQVAVAAKAYRVYYAKLEAEGGDPDEYFMGHATSTFLIGPDGKYLTTFSGGTSPQDMAEETRKLLSSAPRSS